jgi:hypothetical protein
VGPGAWQCWQCWCCGLGVRGSCWVSKLTVALWGGWPVVCLVRIGNLLARLRHVHCSLLGLCAGLALGGIAKIAAACGAVRHDTAIATTQRA